MTDVPRLLIGTTKGAFILDGSADRADWSVRGPYCDGWPINHVVGDPDTVAERFAEWKALCPAHLGQGR